MNSTKKYHRTFWKFIFSNSFFDKNNSFYHFYEYKQYIIEIQIFHRTSYYHFIHNFNTSRIFAKWRTFRAKKISHTSHTIHCNSKTNNPIHILTATTHTKTSFKTTQITKINKKHPKAPQKPPKTKKDLFFNGPSTNRNPNFQPNFSRF